LNLLFESGTTPKQHRTCSSFNNVGIRVGIEQMVVSTN